MAEEKTNFEHLLKRVDELVRILRFLSEDLNQISKALKARANDVRVASSAKTIKPIPTLKEKQQTRPLEDSVSRNILSIDNVATEIQKVFPPDLVSMLFFEVTADYICVKPRQYLGSDNFRRVATIIRDHLKGEYVSAGRDSHFRIMKKTKSD